MRGFWRCRLDVDDLISQERGSAYVLPITTKAFDLLLARPCLHGLARFAEFQGDLLATEADPRQGCTGIDVRAVDRGIARRGGAKIHQMCRCFGNYVLALQDAY